MTMWDLDDEHEAFQAVCRRFVDEKMKPLVRSSEEAGTFPAELWPAMADAGLLGLRIPQEYGGSDADALAVTILAEEMGRASGGLAITPLVSSYMAGSHIPKYGNDAQKERWLPAMAEGRVCVAIAVTEPDVGSDVAGIRSTGERVDGGWVLRGTKMFITNSGLADVIIVAVKTNPDAGRRGMTTFLVEAGTKGLELGPKLVKMGWRSSDTHEVVLNECFVADDAVLGQVDRAFYQIMGAFQLERVLLGAMGLGLAEDCIQETYQYAADRRVFGSPLLSMQTIRHRLAEMRSELQGARLMTYQAAERLDNNHPRAEESVAMAKVVAARVANTVANEAVQLFGGQGFMDETPVARHYRDARVLRIGGGTDEIQLEILAKRAAP